MEDNCRNLNLRIICKEMRIKKTYTKILAKRYKNTKKTP